MAARHGSVAERLIARLDEAVGRPETSRICEQVKRVLEEEISGAGLRLPEAILEALPGNYARRLLYRDPAGRYTVVVMVWGPGQSTPIHDHAGKWCVECVYCGRIRVTSYDLVSGQEAPEGEENVVELRQDDEVEAGFGEAGALIPPFDYHVIANPYDRTAVTVHVYGGEMDGCHRFDPLGARRYRRVWCDLCYSP